MVLCSVEDVHLLWSEMCPSMDFGKCLLGQLEKENLAVLNICWLRWMAVFVCYSFDDDIVSMNDGVVEALNKSV